MYLIFLVEDLSTREFLLKLLPKILSKNIYSDDDIYHFQSKNDLLKKLPKRLKAYKAWIPDEYKIIVILDRDQEDCQNLKNQLETIAKEAGFITKSAAQNNQDFQVLNRIAIEELEAWFFGDIQALTQAYPGVSEHLGKQAKYRDPDAITGGTWEALERLLKKAGYHQGGLEKIKAAKEITPYMNPENNSSKSFQVFYNALLEIIRE